MVCLHQKVYNFIRCITSYTWIQQNLYECLHFSQTYKTVCVYICTCTCMWYIMLKLLQLYLRQQCCLKFRKNTQVHARGISYFKHSRTLTVQRGSKLLPLQRTLICHLYLRTVEIKPGYKHVNILLSLL